MVNNYEEPRFQTISKFSGFEIRKYFDSVQAIVETNGRDWQSSTVGFRRLQDIFLVGIIEIKKLL